MTQYTLVLSQSDIVWPGVIQGIGLGLVFVPLSAATFATLSPADARRRHGDVQPDPQYRQLDRHRAGADAAGAQHADHARLADGTGHQRQSGAAANLATPATQPAAALNNEITRQASMIAYVDDYWLMMILTLCVIPLLLLVNRRPRTRRR
jgi:DHA2 family multidrug resistance protein